ncbi:transmembrane protein 180-like [Babylonia areolata]|uniref:transmembrane protein 180-like n=1 Tax=Babylonia areolata TaxID=304850 RepID=UPI003FD390F6
MTLKSRMLAYCASVLGLTMIHHTFNFYYVKVYLNRYHIPESWFHLAQVLFLVWNAVNDPLFAVLQDNAKFTITRTRRESILYTAPFLALSYLVPWFQVGGSGGWAVGVHLIAALCLYDTMFTFIGLALCCLFTEISTDQQDRLQLTKYAQAAGMLGHNAILLFEYTSHSLQNFAAFQVTAVCVAVCGMGLMIYTGLHAHTVWDLRAAGDSREEHLLQIKAVGKEEEEEEERKKKTAGGAESGGSEPYWLKTWQILSEKNFLAFVVTNFFQEFHKTYLSNFTAIVCDYLIPSTQVPVAVRSVFYGSTGLLGGLMVIFGAPIVGRFGYFRTIRVSFVYKMGSGVLMYLLGRSNPWLLMLFILLDTSCTGASYSLFNMPLSDISDHDQVKYNRKHPISSTVYGANALVVKPANSLSPMLVVAILNHFGYEQLKDGLLDRDSAETVKDVMFTLVCFYPVVLGAVQLFTWSHFTIRRSISHHIHVAAPDSYSL